MRRRDQDPEKEGPKDSGGQIPTDGRETQGVWRWGGVGVGTGQKQRERERNYINQGESLRRKFHEVSREGRKEGESNRYFFCRGPLVHPA